MWERKVQYGAAPAAYAQGQGLYTPANSGKLFDQSAVAATGIPKEVIPPTAGQRWAYQVVPNGNSTDANEQLQLVFKLSNLAAKAGSSVNFGTGDQFITVRGFKRWQWQYCRTGKRKDLYYLESRTLHLTRATFPQYLIPVLSAFG